MTIATTTKSRLARFLVLALFVTLSVGGGGVIGTMNLPGDWYAGLAKPFFNPPNWVFGPVWTVLYAIIGFVGWRVWGMGDALLQRLWWGQLALNFLWSPLFFGAERLGWALIDILGVLTLILWFIATAWQRDRLSALAFVPYVCWVGFASALNGAILALN